MSLTLEWSALNCGSTQYIEHSIDYRMLPHITS